MAKQYSLGLIETIGLTAAIVAADAAVKSANVTLVGYELSKGDGMTLIKVQGDVGAVTAAVSAASMAAGAIGRVVSTKVIARPAASLEALICTPDTVGVAKVKTPPPCPCAACVLNSAPIAEAKPDQTSPDQTSPDQTSPDQTSPEQSSPEQSSPEQSEDTPNSDEPEPEGDDEPNDHGHESATVGDSEKADSQKKRKKKK